MVTSDNVAESGSGQLTVKLGQQLEVLDKFNLDKTMVMVRTTTDKPEIGYIPVTCLNDPGKVSKIILYIIYIYFFQLMSLSKIRLESVNIKHFVHVNPCKVSLLSIFH